MTCSIRKWKMSDAADLASAISNKKVQENLRDGLVQRISRPCFPQMKMKPFLLPSRQRET